MSLRLTAMQQNKSLCLSDFIRNPDAVIEDFTEVPDDNDIEYVKEYGIGVDCHAKKNTVNQ